MCHLSCVLAQGKVKGSSFGVESIRLDFSLQGRCGKWKHSGAFKIGERGASREYAYQRVSKIHGFHGFNFQLSANFIRISALSLVTHMSSAITTTPVHSARSEYVCVFIDAHPLALKLGTSATSIATTTTQAPRASFVPQDSNSKHASLSSPQSWAARSPRL